jgi:hypothetical protein
MPDHVPAATIKQRARELRALSEKKSAAFRNSQLHATLEVLTLRHTRDLSPVGAGFTPPGVPFNHAVSEGSRLPTSNPTQPAPWTPAISTNYLQLRLSGAFPPNQLLRAKITHHENGVLHALPEIESTFAVHHSTSRL